MLHTKKTISERIIEGLNLRDIKQSDLCSMTGISKGALSSYISGRYIPKQNNIYLISKALNVNESWLMGYDVPYSRHSQNAQTTKGVSINILGRVAAGIPISAVQEIIDTEEISEDMARSGEYFGLKIRGDSMEPRICDGDVVIVRKQDDAEDGDIVIAMVNGDDATCKRLKKYDDGIRLIPNNPAYEPLYFSNQDIQSMPVKILGRVVENRQKY